MNPHVAAALRCADWNIQTVTELFKVSPQKKVPDEDIIRRCAGEDLAWITADLRARKKHRRLLLENPISVLWVRRPDAGMNVRYELALLANALRHFDQCIGVDPDWAIHCRVGYVLPEPIEELERFPRLRRGS
ncbi:MAG: hypothetical protein ACRDI2_01935 [Chloroflexota bacterium]